LLNLSLETSPGTAEPALDSLEMNFEEVTAETPLELDDAGEISASSSEPEAAEGGDRIQKLLAEGKEMYEQGEYQSSIDIWSRIFLIDIDNTEASRLIEEARSKKAELERQAEELFHQGAGMIEQRRLEEAKAAFRQVLDIDPSHSLAREYLEQLDAGQVPTLAKGGEAEILTPPDGLEGGVISEGGNQQSMEAAVQRDRIIVTKKMDRRLIALGALVAILVVGGGAFLAMKWDDLFPNQKEVTTAPVRRIDPIEKATQLHAEGKTDEAIRILGTIVDSDPVFQDAGALIAQWRAEAEAPPEDVATGPSEEQLARRGLLLQAAQQAYAERRFIRAQKYFNAAEKIAALDAEDAALLAECNESLASLSKEMELFAKAEYQRLIPGLWQRREKEPDNPDLDVLLVDSYYNLALTDLQRGDALGASEKLKEALLVQPENRELQRLELFAKTYSSRPNDLLYRIFVKYLPSRS
jgi:tetratricopeptide (TPR) repeat protein